MQDSGGKSENIDESVNKLWDSMASSFLIFFQISVKYSDAFFSFPFAKKERKSAFIDPTDIPVITS